MLKGSHKARLIKKVGAMGVLTVAALAFPAVASAHHATIDVSCTNATFKYVSFHGTNSQVNWVVKVDDVPVVTGTHTFTGQSTLNVPLTIYGDHKVVAETWWNTNGEKGNESYTEHVSCGAAPAPPTPAPPASGSAPATAPASGVQGVQVNSPAAAPARAVLGTRTSCRSNVVRARVSGRGMRRVTFSVNGKRVRTVAVRGRRVVRATLPRRGSGPQAITVRVRYTNRTQVLTTRAARCSQAQVAPQFTG